MWEREVPRLLNKIERGAGAFRYASNSVDAIPSPAPPNAIRNCY